jgi:hypothetical protein
MPRLIGMLLLLLASIGIAKWLSSQNGSRGDDGRRGKTFRPRRKSAFDVFDEDPTDSTAQTDCFVMSRSSASLVCDALTGGPLHTESANSIGGGVLRCVKCSSLYNKASVTALEKDNAGACVQCGSSQRMSVVFTDD